MSNPVDLMLEIVFIYSPSQEVKECFTKVFHDMSNDGA
jgi:hypothetical protein